jgi:hypothetical protein
MTIGSCWSTEPVLAYTGWPVPKGLSTNTNKTKSWKIRLDFIVSSSLLNFLQNSISVGQNSGFYDRLIFLLFSDVRTESSGNEQWLRGQLTLSIQLLGFY